MTNISDSLVKWFMQHGRDYPWRSTGDPYKILVAEVMLQRTRANQVKSAFVRFLKEFPSPQQLAKAPKRSIGKYFAVLGLRWRAGLIKMLARDLVDKFDGAVPENREALLSLRAVGEYAADAVLAFAFGKKVAVVDANVCRIVGRVYGIEAKGEARRDLRFREIAQSLLPHECVKEFNLAMIDLAALICTPRNPKCDTCPIKSYCSYCQVKYVLPYGDEK